MKVIDSVLGISITNPGLAMLQNPVVILAQKGRISHKQEPEVMDKIKFNQRW